MSDRDGNGGNALSDAPVVHAPWTDAFGGGAIVTTRHGGVGVAPFATLNLGHHVGDDPVAVTANRATVRHWIGGRRVAWLAQCHGDRVVDALLAADASDAGVPLQADAVITNAPGLACAVMVADCLPVLFRGMAGQVVGAAHAGWRGLCHGVLERTVAAMRQRANGMGPDVWQAWIGPAIGPTAFEVGREVRNAFLAAATVDERDATDAAFIPGPVAGKFLGDLPMLARLRLARVGVHDVSGGTICTVLDADRFFSYRREGRTGRFAALIWR